MLTDDEVAATIAYSGAAYRPINAALRGEEPLDAAIRSRIEAIDAAIAKSRMPDGLTVYRGLDGDGADYLRSLGLRIGDTYIEAGFMSTSTDPAAARLFAVVPPGGLILRIRLPRGSAALDLAPYSDHPNEREVLLPRGTRLRLLGLTDTGMVDTEVDIDG